MIKEARLLKEKAVNSLLLSIDHFNRVTDVGRPEAVLIFADHSFEMLLKAAILAKGGKIRESREKNTIGFDRCVRKALSELSFITDEQALVLQTINGLRDAAQHHLVELSESQLYFHAQSGVTLFRDLLRDVFSEELGAVLPERVLPVSTVVLSDPLHMFSTEVEVVRELLAPGRRKRAEAVAKLRGIAIVDSALRGDPAQPGDGELQRLGSRLVSGESFSDVFPGIGSINFSTDGSGPQMGLRITKKEGVPVTLVPEGTAGSSVVAVHKVDLLGFYNLGHADLAKKVGLNRSKTTAAIAVGGLKTDPDCYKEVAVGKVRYQRYSQKAIECVQRLVELKGVDQIWTEYKALRQLA
ncbi:DUF3644 domain-containing protein [Microbacterium sp. CGR1]|uniref:DUF3644 domain-containing protein n=1 Tax=Microbacterium sp. CGR1 TaxID=1696072 RepID=UPI003DA5201E